MAPSRRASPALTRAGPGLEGDPPPPPLCLIFANPGVGMPVPSPLFVVVVAAAVVAVRRGVVEVVALLALGVPPCSSIYDMLADGL